MKVSYIFFGMLFTSSVLADNCNSLIQHGLYNEVRKSSVVDSYQEVVNNICKDYSSYKSDKKSGKVKATYGAFGGKAGFNASTYEKLSQSMCSEFGSIDKLAKNRNVLEKIISPEAIDAYKTCQSLNAKGLKVDTKISENGDHISVSLHYAAVGMGLNGNEIEIQQPYITDPKQFKCGGSLKPNSKLPVNTNVEYHCQRKISGKENDIFTYKGRRMYANSATLTIPLSVTTIYRVLPAVYAEQIPSPVKGAVLAFATDCPIGWAPYKKAESRYIVGTGKGKVINQEGGAEDIRLSVGQMPKHQHNTPQAMDNTGPNFGLGPRRKAVHGRLWAPLETEMTSWVGEGNPINIEPPYIALNYCIKN